MSEGAKKKIYNVFKNMEYRCKNPQHPRYEDYGGRGISICSEWEDFEGFYNWAISSGYEE